MNPTATSFSRAVAILSISAGLLATTGCRSQAAPRPPAEQRPKVTVAQPVLASVADFSEHTGRTEAPESVEIRTRASGYLVRVAFKEGDLVKKGDLLFVIDPRPYQAALARAKADLESIRADHQLAKSNAARAQRLYKDNAISQQGLEAQTSAVEQLAARQAAAVAAVSSASLDLDYAFVRSPISGRIGRALITVGNIVGPGTASPLATVVSVNPLYVYVDVDEVRGQRLRQASASVAQLGFPGEEGYPHQAPIDFIDNRVDPATGTLRVRAVVDNGDGRLTHGLFARVRLSDGDAHQRLLVADRAVANDQDRRFVWVVGGDGKAVRRPVKLGPVDGGLRVVREGLAPSDKVVVRGLQRLRPGVEVIPELVSMRQADGEVLQAQGQR